MTSTARKAILVTAAAVGMVVLSLGAGFLGSRWSMMSGSDSAVPVGLVFNNDTAPPEISGDDSTVSGDAVSRAFENQFRNVAAATLPVVAEINVVSHVTRTVATSPFNFFFGNPGQAQPREQEFTQEGLGSGVLVARDGDVVYVLTNNHVAGEADEIEVVLYDGRSYQADLVGTDDLMDLALVSFKTSDEVPLARLGNSDSLEVGDWVFAVGNPLGFQSTVTAGIISAKSRDPQPGTGMQGVTSYIQTDAAINQGNSGGALVNMNGEVVGINTWIASQNGGNIGLGFAIPANSARRAIRDFIDSGSVAYSWLGVQTGSPGEDLADDLGIQNRDGAFVFGVYENSPAGKAGVRAGDLITNVGGTEISDSSSLVKTIANLEIGSPETLTVIRDGKTATLTIRTERRGADSGTDTSDLWPGIAVVPVSDEVRTQLDLERGSTGVVVAQVNADSAAGSGGLQQGDLITEVNGSRIRDAADFYSAVGEGSGETMFKVFRGGRYLSFGFERG